VNPDVSLIAAFVAGVLSFISPCVLPLVPGYLSFISGVSLESMRSAPGDTAAPAPPGLGRQVFFASLAFVFGFSVVFIALGAAASTLGAALLEWRNVMGKIAGVLLVIFGLHTMGLLKVSWLYQEKRIQTNAKPAGLVGAFVVGLAFAFGWTPCIGPILGTILALAADEGNLQRGVVLLSVYSLGLGVPFLLTSLMVNQFFKAFAKIRRHYKLIEITAGVLMVTVGVLIFTNRFTIITQYLTPYLPTF
jgi:cytochrome c-type biogenesis protein